MCGIIGYTGTKQSREILLNGLDKLEYRGYDSAGLAIQNGGINIIKTEGSIKDLREKTPDIFEGKTGIAHTRWATHGAPTEVNSHPHLSPSGELVLVHNGIIENSEELKLSSEIDTGRLISDTDTEVLLNIIDMHYLSNGRDILKALLDSFCLCHGSYALVLIESKRPGELIVCKKGSPIVIAHDDTGSYVASDIYALAEYTDRFFFPEDGDIVFLNRKGVSAAYNSDGHIKSLTEKRYFVSGDIVGKGDFEHYMLKEIHEQAIIVKSLTDSGLIVESELYSKSERENIFRNIERITILGCGTSWHAGLVGRYLIEKFARIPVNTEYASEYRYRDPVISKSDLVISISQSGETADTLAANRLAREAGAFTLGIINVQNSSLERETDMQIYLRAGAEIGVASTKAYTSQLAILSMLTSWICELKDNKIASDMISSSLAELPSLISDALDMADEIKELASKYSKSNNFLFLGRGINYPSALEGALKLKEISYIHAEGYPGAEMKHGPIALIDYHFPTLAIVTDTENRSKMISNIREIKAREGKVIAFCVADDEITPKIVDDVIVFPKVADVLTPILSAIPLQLFSYYVSVFRECNIDKPRNLAKSVTVE